MNNDVLKINDYKFSISARVLIDFNDTEYKHISENLATNSDLSETLQIFRGSLLSMNDSYDVVLSRFVINNLIKEMNNKEYNNGNHQA